MLNEKALLEFVSPYYEDKDIMHNMWHVELVQRMIDRILSLSDYEVDREALKLATYFHGFIYSDEEKEFIWTNIKLVANVKQSMQEKTIYQKQHLEHGLKKKIFRILEC